MTILISSADKFRKKPLKKLSKQFAHANESAGEQDWQKDLWRCRCLHRVWKSTTTRHDKIELLSIDDFPPPLLPLASLIPQSANNNVCNSRRLREGVEIVEWRGRVPLTGTDVSGQQSCGLDSSHGVGHKVSARCCRCCGCCCCCCYCCCYCCCSPM